MLRQILLITYILGVLWFGYSSKDMRKLDLANRTQFAAYAFGITVAIALWPVWAVKAIIEDTL